MNDPLIGVYSAWINLIVRRLRRFKIGTMLVRETTRNFGPKQDDKQFDGMIGLVQQIVSKTIGKVLLTNYLCD